ncbi:MAG: hypothetical protein NWQ46_07885 [Spirosomaceae bacterium]|nr:hypothetical protein [Spirosomataceae bacterium]
MLKNYFKIAWRSLLKRRTYSLLLVSSLAVGFGFTFVLGNFILGELAINQQVKSVENHYFMKSKWVSEDMGPPITTVAALAEDLKVNYPELVKNHYTFDCVQMFRTEKRSSKSPFNWVLPTYLICLGFRFCTVIQKRH